MSRRGKMTPFARFLIALMIIAPLAFIGASYYNGQDPWAIIQEKLGLQKAEATETSEAREAVADNDTYDLRRQIEQLQQRVDQLERENAELREKVRRLESGQ